MQPADLGRTSSKDLRHFNHAKWFSFFFWEMMYYLKIVESPSPQWNKERNKLKINKAHTKLVSISHATNEMKNMESVVKKLMLRDPRTEQATLIYLISFVMITLAVKRYLEFVYEGDIVCHFLLGELTLTPRAKFCPNVWPKPRTPHPIKGL